MASSVLQSILYANSCALTNQRIHGRSPRFAKGGCRIFTVTAVSEEADCNVEECAPDKEVGKVSMEWVAGEKTKVLGTYPPRKKGWTGYVEKDTAGQTNIYSIEPSVYVAESAISSGNAGTSSEGAENTAAIAAGLALISVAAASSILLQVSKTSAPEVKSVVYSGPPLSYYINKFKPVETVEISAPPESQSPPTVEASAAPESEVALDVQPESSDANVVPEAQVEPEEQVGS